MPWRAAYSLWMNLTAMRGESAVHGEAFLILHNQLHVLRIQTDGIPGISPLAYGLGDQTKGEVVGQRGKLRVVHLESLYMGEREQREEKQRG